MLEDKIANIEESNKTRRQYDKKAIIQDEKTTIMHAYKKARKQ